METVLGYISKLRNLNKKCEFLWVMYWFKLPYTAFFKKVLSWGFKINNKKPKYIKTTYTPNLHIWKGLSGFSATRPKNLLFETRFFFRNMKITGTSVSGKNFLEIQADRASDSGDFLFFTRVCTMNVSVFKIKIPNLYFCEWPSGWYVAKESSLHLLSTIWLISFVT